MAFDDDEDEFATNLAKRAGYALPRRDEGEFTSPIEDYAVPVGGDEFQSRPSGPEDVTFPPLPNVRRLTGKRGEMPRTPDDPVDNPETYPGFQYDLQPREGETLGEFQARNRPPEEGLHGQALWDQIGKDMDAFQEHANPNYKPPQEEGPDEADQPRTGYFGGGFGVPPLRVGSDGQAYIADNEGNPVMLGGRPVSLEDYHRSVGAGRHSEDPLEQWRHAQDLEAAKFNSSLYHMNLTGSTPQQFDLVQGMVGQREKQLKDLMLQIHNDPTLDDKTRAHAAMHLYQQMGQLAQHAQTAQEKKQELQTPLNQGEKIRLQRLHQAASWLDESIGNGTLDANNPAVQEARQNVRGRINQFGARQAVEQQAQSPQALIQQHLVQGPDGHSYLWDPKKGGFAPVKEQATKAAPGSHHEWETMPLDKKRDVIKKHQQDYGQTWDQARQEVEQEMRSLAPAQTSAAPAEDHPSLRGYLGGAFPAGPNDLAQMSRQITPQTRQHLQHVVNAGEDYGWRMARDATGQSRMERDPEQQAYQQRAKALLQGSPAAGGAPPPRRLTQKQMNDQAAHEQKMKQDAENHAKKADEAFAKHGLDLRHRAIEELHKEWSVKEGAGQDAKHPTPMPADEDEREQQIERRRMKLDPGHVEEELARKYLGPGNPKQQGPPMPSQQAAPQPAPPAVQPPQTGHLSKPWFNEMAQKVGVDPHMPRHGQFPVPEARAALAMPQTRGNEAERKRKVLGALEGMVEAHGASPDTTVAMSREERFLFLRLLQEAKSFDPTLPDVEMSRFGLTDEGLPIPRKGASPF